MSSYYDSFGDTSIGDDDPEGVPDMSNERPQGEPNDGEDEIDICCIACANGDHCVDGLGDCECGCHDSDPEIINRMTKEIINPQIDQNEWQHFTTCAIANCATCRRLNVEFKKATEAAYDRYANGGV